jgi:SNF2 family DNA or RNA helicase
MMGVRTAPTVSDTDIEQLLVGRVTSCSVERCKSDAVFPIVARHTIPLGYPDTHKEAARKWLRAYQYLLQQVGRYTTEGRPVPPDLMSQLYTTLTRARMYEDLGTPTKKETMELTAEQTLAAPKVQWILEYIQRNPEKKIVIASDFVCVLEQLSRVVPVATVLYHGLFDLKQRSDGLDAFRGSTNVLLLSRKAGGVGLSLFAHAMIFVEPAMTQATDSQTTARIIRMGQSHMVDVYYLLLPGMDSFIHSKQLDKLLDSVPFNANGLEEAAKIFSPLLLQQARDKHSKVRGSPYLRRGRLPDRP